MPKGGARVASDLFTVGKGMGLDKHYELLLYISNVNRVTAKEAIEYLNKKFAWWDDPNAEGPTETCRSYLKELWRLGLILRISPSSHTIIAIDQNTWRGGEQPPTYRISQLGKYLLSQSKDLFPYYIAWCIINAYKKKVYPQVDKLFQLYSHERCIPINDDEHVRLSKGHNIYVEKHAGKAIKFGWLEPTGLIYRITRKYFALNEKFIRHLENINIEDLFYDIKIGLSKTADVSFQLIEETLGITSFSTNSRYSFHIEVTNNTKERVKILVNPYLFSIFSHISRIETPEQITLDAYENNILTFQFESKAIKLSDSLMEAKIGYVEFRFNGKSHKMFLPQVSIMNEDRIWELELCYLFRQLDLKVFHLTGKSDRPDAVIDLSGLSTEPVDLLAYLRDGSIDKILMETTLGKYSGSKLIADTIKQNTRGFNKYETHTQFVLKIAALGQLVTANTFVGNINEYLESVREKAGHNITLIDKNALLYLIEKYNQTRNRENVIALIKSSKRIDIAEIDKIFSN